MSTTPNISKAEWKLMKLLWAESPQSSGQIIDALAGKEEWHPNTIKTLLSRLYRKGAVKVQKQKKMFLYRPAISAAQGVRVEGQSFQDKVFGGSVKPLLIY